MFGSRFGDAPLVRSMRRPYGARHEAFVSTDASFACGNGDDSNVGFVRSSSFQTLGMPLDRKPVSRSTDNLNASALTRRLCWPRKRTEITSPGRLVSPALRPGGNAFPDIGDVRAFHHAFVRYKTPWRRKIPLCLGGANPSVRGTYLQVHGKYVTAIREGIDHPDNQPTRQTMGSYLQQRRHSGFGRSGQTVAPGTHRHHSRPKLPFDRANSRTWIEPRTSRLNISESNR